MSLSNSADSLITPLLIFQIALEKLSEDNAYRSAQFESQKASAETSASDAQASLSEKLARAVLDASDQRAQFDNEMAEAKLAAGDMQNAFDKLTCDHTNQKADFDSRLSRADLNAGGMKVSILGKMTKWGVPSEYCLSETPSSSAL